MKFEQLDEVPVEFPVQVKTLGECGCGAFTRWWDRCLKKHICSVECGEQAYRQYLSDDMVNCSLKRIGLYADEIQHEEDLEFRHYEDDYNYWKMSKDILIVVHDQLEYVKQCIESIDAWTVNHNLYIWDNESGRETREYLESLKSSHGARLIRSDANKGFIKPNNELAKLGQSDYIICLNSDTEVWAGWTAALCGKLEEEPEVAQTGCLGGLLEADGTGSYTNFGCDVDYIMGWCFCMRREDYKKYGLFNEDLTFAYFEDADLSLRLKSFGHKVYAFHMPIVHHYGNKTLSSVDIDLMETIRSNHAIFREMWQGYLGSDRVMAPRKPRIWGSPGVPKKIAQA